MSVIEKIKNCFTQESKKPIIEPTTHDISRWQYSVSSVLDDGNTIHLHGWHYGIDLGDFIILYHKDGDTTRYQVVEVKYASDPRDMFIAKAIFAPRQYVTEE